MEIISSDFSLRDEIMGDAKKKSERIRKKAHSDTKELQKASEKEIESISSHYETSILEKTDEQVNFIKASIEIEVKKKCLSYIGEKMEKILKDLIQKVETGQLMPYQKFLEGLLNYGSTQIASDKYSLEIGSIINKKLNNHSLNDLKLKKGVISEVSILENTDGMKLYSSDRKRVIFLSPKHFIQQIFDDNRNQVYNLLTNRD